ncbi:MAG: hypothetical protein IJK85_01020, partial [Bacteroidales bacterium]|nr:hypothetical protein [Bacteroidales bacterium]
AGARPEWCHMLSGAGVGRPLGLPGSVAQAFTERVVAGRQVCGQEGTVSQEIYLFTNFTILLAPSSDKNLSNIRIIKYFLRLLNFYKKSVLLQPENLKRKIL